MASRNRLVSLLVLPLLAAAPCASLAEQPPVRAYTAADGLAGYNIFGILADSRGFLWFSTGDGLSRFDGYAFTTYTVDDGLPDRRVSEILETRTGDYWVATEGGLCRFDPRGVRGSAESPPFVRVTIGDGGSAEDVRALAEARDGALWCATMAGLYRLEARDGLVASTRVDLGTPAGVNTIVADRGGDVWAGTREDKGLYRVRSDGAVERQHVPEASSYFEPEVLFEDRDGGLWVGSRSGLCYAAPSADGGPRAFEELASRWTTSFYQTADGALLVGTTAGLWRMTGASGRPQFERVASLDSACDREVWGIAEDRDGNVWLTTRCGVLRVGRYGFTKYSTSDGLVSEGINSIFESRTGDLVVTTNFSKRVVHFFDGTKFTHVAPNLLRPTLSGWGWGQTIVQDRDGAWWVPSAVGLFRFPTATRPEAALAARPEPILTGCQIFRVFEDSRGDVWFSATLPAKLFRWERERAEVVDLTSTAGVPGVEYTAFVESGDGAVWIGTSDGLLLRYADGRFTTLGVDDGVPRGWLRDLHVDLAGRLWIASSLEGLGRVDDPAAVPPTISAFRHAGGLSSDNVYCVVDDAFGRVYAGTGQGVDRLDLSTGRVKHFSSVDGLPNGYVETCIRDRSGRLWFGSTFGLVRFDPEPERRREPPRTLVTGLRVSGVARPVSSLGEVALLELELGSDENSVSVDFLGLGTSLGEQLGYQYELDGAGGDWSAPSSERTVTFANLAPGSYRFLVRAVDADGVASREPAVVAFTIAAPFWQRWWFLALAAALVAAAGYALHRYRIERLLEVERVRTRIATDLHDDIGANLTRISVLSEVASYRSGGGDESLRSIARISRESVASMSDIVWAINPKRDSFRDLVRRMRELANEALGSAGVEVRFSAPESDGDQKLGHDTRRELFLIYKEAVTNAARHSGCEHVDVTVALDGRKLVLEVSDDGCGFDPSIRAGGNGLANMRKRAAAIGGRLDVRSAPGEGMCVRLEVPLARSAA